MNYCCIHGQFYAEACAYCGPPQFQQKTTEAHVCTSLGTGGCCFICGKRIYYEYGITWCSDDSIRYDHTTIT